MKQLPTYSSRYSQIHKGKKFFKRRGNIRRKGKGSCFKSVHSLIGLGQHFASTVLVNPCNNFANAYLVWDATTGSVFRATGDNPNFYPFQKIYWPNIWRRAKIFFWKSNNFRWYKWHLAWPVVEDANYCINMSVSMRTEMISYIFRK